MTTANSAMGYFIRAFVLTFGLQLPAVLAKLGVISGGAERYMGLAALGALGPVIAATWSAWSAGGKNGVKALYARMKIWRVGWQWYLVALGFSTVIYLCAHTIARVVGVPSAGRWLYPPENAQHIAGLLMMPLNEEIGWRGWALPRLEQRFRVLPAALILGVIWAFWHSTMFILQGETALSWTAMVVYVLAGSVIFSWIFHHTQGSLLLAVLAHVGVHLNNPAHDFPKNVTPLVLATVGMVVAAIAVVVVDRKVWKAANE